MQSPMYLSIVPLHSKTSLVRLVSKIFIISVSFLNFLLESTITDIYYSIVILFIYSLGITLKYLSNFTELFSSFSNILSFSQSLFVMFCIGYIYYYMLKIIYFILNKIKKIHLKD